MRPAVLDRPTLILNKNWLPVSVATVARALTLLWNEQARVIDPADYQIYAWADWAAPLPRDGEPCIRAVRQRVRAPEVLVLSRYDRLPTTQVTFSRRNIFKRDHFTCQYCGAQPGGAELTLDHVVPRTQGGCRAGRIACSPASSATSARPTAPPLRPA